MKAKKMVCFIVLCSLLCTTFTGCSSVVDTKKKDGRLKVVATVFAEYDFLRHIAGDKINLSMLMLPGADLHAFDPTPKDVASVQSADLFVTIGGESDAWSEKIMESVDNKNLQTIKLMDCVSNVVEEEVVEGMQTEEEGQGDKEKEFDEHVWTSLGKMRSRSWNIFGISYVRWMQRMQRHTKRMPPLTLRSCRILMHNLPMWFRMQKEKKSSWQTVFRFDICRCLWTDLLCSISGLLNTDRCECRNDFPF